ncbi:MAG: class I SAM-dependent methyltransferase [Methyloceanibacter sp.]
MLEGIPMLAMLDEEHAQQSGDGQPSAESYQRRYQQVESAAIYNQAYRERPLKRWSTRREFQLLERLLASQPRCRTLLDIPCGGGRLSPPQARFTDLLIEADVGLGQVRYARQHGLVETAQAWMTASALHIPFEDAAVDGVACIRLCHHLPETKQREELVAELLRVASRFVLMTFFDYHSFKNLLRRARRPFNRKPPKMTMSVAEVGKLARRHGARLAAFPPLSRFGSGHRYALMVKA